MERLSAQPLENRTPAPTVSAEENPMETVFISLCGEVQIGVPDGVPVAVRGSQPATILAFLALAEAPVLRDGLAHVLWGDDLPKHWQGALRGVVSKVRAAFVEAGLGPNSVYSEGGHVGFSPNLQVKTDIRRARDAFEQAKADFMSGRHQTAAAACLEATDILERPFLHRDGSQWAVIQRVRIQELATQTSHLHLEALKALPGATASAIDRARQQISRDPLDEIAYHQLIEALLASGQRTAALETYEKLANILHYELGIDPERNTTVLVEAIKASVGTPDGSTSNSRLVDLKARPIERTLHPYDTDPFVGRVTELAQLNEIWNDVVYKQAPQIVLLEGPAGAGKTRLASQFCHWVAGAGTGIVWGRNREGSNAAYGALSEALAMAIDYVPAVIERLGQAVAPLASVFPHLAWQFDYYDAPSDPALARAQLYDAFRTVVEELVTQPAVLVLDDLHWSSPDTLDLLEYLLGLAQVPLLIVATARALPARVHGSLAALGRLVPVTKMSLPGLSVGELVELISYGFDVPSADRQANSAELASLLHARTGGLAFFSAELARAARSSGVPIDPHTVPLAARDWVVHRVASLSESEIRILEWAAALGLSVDIETLEACALDVDADVFEVCDSLVQHGLFTDAVDDGTLEFSHAITRDVIYEGLSRTRRLRLHRQIAEVLANDYQSQSQLTPQDHGLLAYHYSRSGSRGMRLAAEQALYAGEKALALGTWESAVLHFDQALALKPSAHVTARTQIGLARANQYLNLTEAAYEHIQLAISEAREWELSIELSEAYLALVGRAGRGIVELSDHEQVRLMREALAALVRDETKYSNDLREPASGVASNKYRYEMVRGQVEQELASALLFLAGFEERRQLLEGSLARAQALQPMNQAALVSALFGMRIVKLDEAGIRSRLGDLDQVLGVPTRKIGQEAVVAAHKYRHEDLLLLQDWQQSKNALEEASYYANRYGFPYWQWAIHAWRGLRANIAGDLETAEQIALEAAGMRPDVAGAEACVGVNLVNIRLYQGRVHEMLDLLASAVDGFPLIPCYRAVLALCAIESGDEKLAEDSYRFFADQNFTNLPMDSNQFLGLGVLSHVAVELGDRAGGAKLEELLFPFRNCWVTLNCYGGGGAHWGPTSHQLGRLAVLNGRKREAEQLLEEALRAAVRANSPFVQARIETDLALLRLS